MLKKYLQDKVVLVLGLGISGSQTIELLKLHNIQYYIVDDQKADDVEIYSTSAFLNKKLNIDVIIKSPGIHYSHKILEVYEGIKIINDIELSYHIAKSRKIKIIGVTGTNGKTSTTTFITKLLQYNGLNAFSCGNIGISPLKVLAEHDKIDYLVMELSSFQLMAIDEFKCDYAFLLNLSPDHLDYHKDLDEYYNAKLNIVKNGTVSNTFFINDEIEFKADSLTIFSNDIDIDWIDDIDSKGINLANVKLVVQLCNILGLPTNSIKELFDNNYQPLPHRLEFVCEVNGVAYYNDSKATNVDATILALSKLENIIIIVGGSNKGENMKRLRPYIKNVKSTIAYGENGKEFSFMPDYYRVETLDEAVKLAEEIAINGDCVVLSPASASFDQFKNYEQRGNYFKELILRGVR